MTFLDALYFVTVFGVVLGLTECMYYVYTNNFPLPEGKFNIDKITNILSKSHKKSKKTRVSIKKRNLFAELKQGIEGTKLNRIKKRKKK